MSVGIYTIYFSPTRETETIVKLLANEFGNYKEIDLCNPEIELKQSFTKEDICIIGVPSYGGRVPAAALQRMQHYTGNQAKTILAVSYGNRAYEDTLKELQEYLTARGFCCIAAISAIAEHSIIRQFAAGRPDQNDKKQLIEFSKQILNKLNQSAEYEALSLPGNKPYREYHGVPLKPNVSKNCKECGLCAKLCPVGAISITEPKKTNHDLCISCMRCVAICPAKARTVSHLKLKLASKKMEKVCSQRKENELFI